MTFDGTVSLTVGRLRIRLGTGARSRPGLPPGSNRGVPDQGLLNLAEVAADEARDQPPWDPVGEKEIQILLMYNLHYRRADVHEIRVVPQKVKRCPRNLPRRDRWRRRPGNRAYQGEDTSGPVAREAPIDRRPRSMARRIASLIPFYEYDERQFFRSDDAPEEVAARRRDGFLQLSSLYPRTLPKDQCAHRRGCERALGPAVHQRLSRAVSVPAGTFATSRRGILPQIVVRRNGHRP